MIGAHSITAISTGVLKDVPPYIIAAGHEAQPYGINAEGLKRRGYSANAITHLRRAYKTLYKSALTLEEAKQALALQVAECPEISLLLDFLALSQRGIIR